MNFSELFRQSAQLCKFSPDGKYLASAVDYRLVIRHMETLQIQQLYTCLDAVQYIEWSSDSQFILCGMYKRGMVQVWSMEVPDWHCKIDEGSAGLCSVIWSPDGRHILTTADFHLRITVWSLVTKSVSYIRYPKQCSKGISFNRAGKYMALAERRDCKDHISIFSCQSWTLIRHFECETDDLAGLEWSPDGRVICVWDSCLTYKILLYALDGRCLARYTAYELALGIKTVAWSPSSQFLAIGSFDEKVRLLNHITWKTVATLCHPQITQGKNVVVYKESETKAPKAPSNVSQTVTASLFTAQSKYELEECPVKMPIIKPSPNKANPKLGVGTLTFSSDNKYMFTCNGVCWDPSRPRVALCTSTNKLYMWSPDGCLSVEVPVEGTFVIHNLLWHPEGEAILLLGKEQMCVCFLAPAEATATAAAQNTSSISSTINGKKNRENDIYKQEMGLHGQNDEPAKLALP